MFSYFILWFLLFLHLCHYAQPLSDSSPFAPRSGGDATTTATTSSSCTPPPILPSIVVYWYPLLKSNLKESFDSGSQFRGGNHFLFSIVVPSTNISFSWSHCFNLLIFTFFFGSVKLCIIYSFQLSYLSTIFDSPIIRGFPFTSGKS